jgi:hypothetical protein
MANGNPDMRDIWSGYETKNAFEQRVRDSLISLPCTSRYEKSREMESDIMEIQKVSERAKGALWVLLPVAGFIGGIVSIVVSWLISKL